MPQLTVDLNKEGLHSIAAPTEFQTGGPFEIQLENHGEAVHVHLNLDDTLSAVGQLRANNHYVEAGRSRRVTVDIEPRPSSIAGRLKIATGYGSEVSYTTVEVTPPNEEPHRVEVDETLAKPQRPEEPEPTGVEKWMNGAVGVPGVVIGFGLLAILIAVGVATTLESTAVVVGSLFVLLGVIVALAVAFRSDAE